VDGRCLGCGYSGIVVVVVVIVVATAAVGVVDKGSGKVPASGLPVEGFAWEKMGL
jgi:hypothetical protein